MQVFKTAICLYYSVFLRSSMFKKKEKKVAYPSFILPSSCLPCIGTSWRRSQPAPRTHRHTRAHKAIRTHAHTHLLLWYYAVAPRLIGHEGAPCGSELLRGGWGWAQGEAWLLLLLLICWIIRLAPHCCCCCLLLRLRKRCWRVALETCASLRSSRSHSKWIRSVSHALRLLSPFSRGSGLAWPDRWLHLTSSHRS